MGESANLRAGDYRVLFRLIGECRDLGADPIAWRAHLLTRLCGWLGAKVGAGGEAYGIDRGHFLPASTVDVGFESDAVRQPMFEWLQYEASRSAPLSLLPLPPATDGIAVTRSDVVGDRQWYNSLQYAEYVRRSELDDVLISFQPIAGTAGRFCGLTLMRAGGEPKFRRRDTTLLQMLHAELAPLVGRQLAAADEPSARKLSPRRQQVLYCLLEGDGEKQVAARLGLTPQTVNQYVKAIYRHFRVSSRGELMARWIRFDRGRPAAQPLVPQFTEPA